MALPSPLVPTHPLKKVKGATPGGSFGDGSNDVAIAFCYDDANLVTVNECGERYQSTCTGSNGQGACCSAAGKCGDSEAHCGEGMQVEYSHSKNLCEEGQSSDGFDQQAAAAAEFAAWRRHEGKKGGSRGGKVCGSAVARKYQQIT